MRKRKAAEDPGTDDSWLLPYADMLTLLLALFIILFAMSKLDAEKQEKLSQIFRSEFSSNQQGIGLEENKLELPSEVSEGIEEKDENDNNDESKSAEELQQLLALQNKIENYIIEKNLSEVLGALLTDEGLLITILNDISFDSGSAKVKEEGMVIAKEISNFLYTDPPHQIVISGHADDRPMNNHEFSSNWELSVIRAVNFMGLLLKNDDLDPKRFSAKGFGQHQPIVPNTNEENRAKNRRVEVLILPNYEIEMNGTIKGETNHE